MRFAGIKPGEGKLALLLFTYFFLITAPHTIIKALKTTNLLMRAGVGALPLAFLSAALLTALVVVLHSKIQFKVSLQLLIVVSLIFFVITGLILQLTLETQFGKRSGWLPYVYWVWASILIVVCMTHFWMTVNELFNPREAKRLIGFISSGGIMGGVLGGALAGLLTRANKGIWLLPIACGLILACVFVVGAIYRERPKQAPEVQRAQPGKDQPAAPRVGFRDSFNVVRRSSYLSLIAAIVAIGIIVSTLIEFQFLSAADAAYGDPNRMQVFFGFFFGAMPLVAFFVNAFLTAKLLKKMKVTLLLAPLTLLAGSLAILLTPFSMGAAMIFHQRERRKPGLLPQANAQGDPVHPGSLRPEIQGQAVHRHVRQPGGQSHRGPHPLGLRHHHAQRGRLSDAGVRPGTGQEPELDRHRLPDTLGDVQPEGRPGIRRGHCRQHQAEMGARGPEP